jgi:hypothetical protein
MSNYTRCPYCGNESDIGRCPYCAPTDIYEPAYTAIDIHGNEVELTEEEYLAIGEDNAVVSYRKRKPNWPWERI